MSDNISQFINSFRTQKGLKAWLKRKLFGCIMPAFEAIDKDIEELADVKDLADTAYVDGKIAVAIAETEPPVKQLRSEVDTISENLRNNNSAIERLCSDSELLKLRTGSLERLSKPVHTENNAVPDTVQISAVKDESDYECIDYFDFENHFRGSIDSVKKAQEAYLKYFRGKAHVLDIGCGRGEFLSLMKDNGIYAEGVDIYAPYADYCNMKGLSASCGDGIAYLAGMECVDGIFVGQVVEHLQTSDIIRLCNTAYEKLPDGGCIVIETPNPTSLSIYTNAFYIDPSHVKPVHPMTMQYLLEKAGFRDIEIVYTQQSRPQTEIPPLHIESGGGNTEEFNKAMKIVSDMIFGSQDYAVIAVKH